MSFELKCPVNSVALKLMLVPFISYSLSAIFACQHGGVNKMGHVTAGALSIPNSRQQSKTVHIKAHFRNEQSCIDEFEVVFV